ncbi:hypothetical protein FOZ62_029335, partial [Perkinsus olseni]
PFQGYPPWSRDFSFDTRKNEALCRYNNLDLESRYEAVGPEVSIMSVQDNLIRTCYIKCPFTTTSPKFYAIYGDDEGRLTAYYPGGGKYTHFHDDGKPFLNDTGLDPLRINSSSIREIKLRLNLAASKIQFRPGYDPAPDTPSYDDDEPTFFYENGDDTTASGGDDEEPEELCLMRKINTTTGPQAPSSQSKS